MIVDRAVPAAARLALEQSGLHPILARVLAARGVRGPEELSTDLAGMLSPALLKGTEEAAILLADAIEAEAAMLVIADYDCDGATACAVAVRGLRMMGARVDYLVPNRFETGYGLTPEIVALALDHPRLGSPDLLITVDNGIASVDGAQAAQDAGLALLITDHHLPGPALPVADAIVNPNAGGCTFPSKAIAGVGVMFYVLIALRAELRRRSLHGSDAPLARLLDLVALGTVADVVRLDANNRLMVAQGLSRIRSGRAQPGLLALFAIAGREPRTASAQDLGFTVGPRINAAGRLADMSVGIECLLTDDPAQAQHLAASLDAINRQRREVERTMQEEALASLAETPAPERRVIVLSDPGWHQGVVGLVAGKLKERFHRPVVALAPAGETYRGSGRSIPGVHLRDCLDLVSKRLPDAIVRFGGHAMAAGLTLRTEALEAFRTALDQAVADLSDPAVFHRQHETDGELDPALADDLLIDALEGPVWGQGFAAPSFHSEFQVLAQRAVGSGHLKLTLRNASSGNTRSGSIDAIWFGRAEPAPDRLHAIWQPVRNTWQGRSKIELQILHAESAE
ncbi:MAG: single-stranded-DNA-specific exonuclease RecJ [Betaproteobacteria bacterium]|nr:single-stranded-DNA-specific exonuclease RecJ [Betaproteobacteria bacterium]